MRKILAALLILNIVLFGFSFRETTPTEEFEVVFNPVYVTRIERIDTGDLTLEQIHQIAELDGTQLEFLSSDDYFLDQFSGSPQPEIITVSTPDFLYLANGQIALEAGRTFTDKEMERFDSDRVPVIAPSHFGWDVGETFQLRNDLAHAIHTFEVIGVFQGEDRYFEPLILPDIFWDHAMWLPFMDIYGEELVQGEMDINKALGAVFLLNEEIDLEAFITAANGILGPAHQVRIEPFRD